MGHENDSPSRGHLQNMVLFADWKRLLALPPTPSAGLVSPLYADVAARLETMRAQNTAAVTKNLNVRKTIDDICGVISRQREVLKLLPQPASSLATAQEISPQSKKKSAIVRALAAGVKHLYGGGRIEASDGIVIGVHSNFVRRVTEEVQKDHGLLLVDSSTSLELSRAIYAALGENTESMYTDTEYSSAVYEFCVESSTYKVLTQKYGLSKSTLQRATKHFKQSFAHKDESQDLCTLRILDLSRPDVHAWLTTEREIGNIKSKGTTPMFSLAESVVILGSYATSAQYGAGSNACAIQSQLTKVAHKLGKDASRAIEHANHTGQHVTPGDYAYAKKLLQANIRPKTLQRMKKRVNDSGVLGQSLAKKGKKPAAISQARAQTTSVYLTKEMFNQMGDMIEQIKQDGSESKFLRVERCSMKSDAARNLFSGLRSCFSRELMDMRMNQS